MKSLIARVCVLGFLILQANCAPHVVEKKSGHLPPTHNLDDPVAALTALKPHSMSKVTSTSSSSRVRDEGLPLVREMSRSSSRLVQDINGERKEMEKQEEKVSRDGHLLTKILHQGENEAASGGPVHSRGVTEVEVPALNIHDRIINKDGKIQTVALPTVKRHTSPAVGHMVMEQKDDENNQQHTLEELATYILETGDQASVAQFLQMLLEQGKITQEEALEYIDTIKRLIDEAQREEGEESADDIEMIRAMVRDNKMEDGEEMKVKALRNMLEGVENDDSESETFLNINEYLEAGLKDGKLSRNTYNHLKEALIESVLDTLQREEAPLDYSTNY